MAIDDATEEVIREALVLAQRAVAVDEEALLSPPDAAAAMTDAAAHLYKDVAGMLARVAVSGQLAEGSPQLAKLNRLVDVYGRRYAELQKQLYASDGDDVLEDTMPDTDETVGESSRLGAIASSTSDLVELLHSHGPLGQSPFASAVFAGSSIGSANAYSLVAAPAPPSYPALRPLHRLELLARSTEAPGCLLDGTVFLTPDMWVPPGGAAVARCKVKSHALRRLARAAERLSPVIAPLSRASDVHVDAALRAFAGIALLVHAELYAAAPRVAEPPCAASVAELEDPAVQERRLAEEEQAGGRRAGTGRIWGRGRAQRVAAAAQGQGQSGAHAGTGHGVAAAPEAGVAAARGGGDEEAGGGEDEGAAAGGGESSVRAVMRPSRLDALLRAQGLAAAATAEGAVADGGAETRQEQPERAATADSVSEGDEAGDTKLEEDEAEEEEDGTTGAVGAVLGAAAGGVTTGAGRLFRGLAEGLRATVAVAADAVSSALATNTPAGQLAAYAQALRGCAASLEGLGLWLEAAAQAEEAERRAEAGGGVVALLGGGCCLDGPALPRRRSTPSVRGMLAGGVSGAEADEVDVDGWHAARREPLCAELVPWAMRAGRLMRSRVRRRLVAAMLLAVSRAVCPVVAADLALLVSVRLQRVEAIAMAAQPIRSVARRM